MWLAVHVLMSILVGLSRSTGKVHTFGRSQQYISILTGMRVSLCDVELSLVCELMSADVPTQHDLQIQLVAVGEHCLQSLHYKNFSNTDKKSSCPIMRKLHHAERRGCVEIPFSRPALQLLLNLYVLNNPAAIASFSRLSCHLPMIANRGGLSRAS